MKKIAITVAPIFAGIEKIEIESTARDIINCVKAGAGVMHLHVRDENGRLTDDLSLFRALTDRVRQEVDVIFQASTGAFSHLSLEQRCEVLYDERVEMTNISVTSNNFGSTVKVITPQDAEYVAQQVKNAGVFPEVEIFEPGDFIAYRELADQVGFDFTPLFNIGLGHKGKQPCTPQAVCAYAGFVPAGAYWDFVEIGYRDFAMTALALGLGADGVRIGLEDGSGFGRDSNIQSNYPIVGELAKLLELMGTEPLTAAEIRQKYGIR